VRSSLGHTTALYRRKLRPRKTLAIDLDAVRREAEARAKAEGKEIDVEARLREAVSDPEVLDTGTRTRAALAMAKEMVNGDVFGSYGGSTRG
jgi:hypothetical protein